MKEKTFFTTGEASRITGISQKTIMNYCSQGKIGSVQTKVTNYRRIPKESLLGFMKKNGIPLDGINERKKVLIIDDEPGVVEAIKLILEQGPFLIDTAADGYEGCVKVGLFKPDVVVLDLYMPKADGFEVCKTIKENPALDGTEILVVTGYKTLENVRKLNALGIEHILGKPFDAGELLGIVNKMASTNTGG